MPAVSPGVDAPPLARRPALTIRDRLASPDRAVMLYSQLEDPFNTCGIDPLRMTSREDTMTYRTLAVATALLALAPGACRNPQAVKAAPGVVNAGVKAGRELVKTDSREVNRGEKVMEGIGEALHTAHPAIEPIKRELEARSAPNPIFSGQAGSSGNATMPEFPAPSTGGSTNR